MTKLQDLQQKSEKIAEMTAVMWHAATTEDRADGAGDVMARLQRENRAMRELLQLELEDSAAADDTPRTGAETDGGRPRSDAAVQTPSSPDDDPFCTGDFATIRLRPVTGRPPPVVTEPCTTGKKTRHSAPNSDDESPFPPSSPVPPGSSSDVSSDSPELTSDAHPSPASDEVDRSAADEFAGVNCSESLETLVNPSELSADGEQLYLD